MMPCIARLVINQLAIIVMGKLENNVRHDKLAPRVRHLRCLYPRNSYMNVNFVEEKMHEPNL